MNRPQRRTFHGCLTCRKRKVRCKGGEPCQNCSRLKMTCHSSFDTNMRVSIGRLPGKKRDVNDNNQRKKLSEEGNSASQNTVSQNLLEAPNGFSLPGNMDGGQKLLQSRTEFTSYEQVNQGPSNAAALDTALLSPLASSISSFDDPLQTSGAFNSSFTEIDSYLIPEAWDFEFSLGPFLGDNFDFPRWPDDTYSTSQLESPPSSTLGANVSHIISPNVQPNSPSRQTTDQWESLPRKESTSDSAESALQHPELGSRQHDSFYFRHYEQCINDWTYSLKDDGRANYLRFILGFIRSSGCSPNSPFRLSVLAWTAKHLEMTSCPRDRTWKSYYSTAMMELEDLSCRSESPNSSSTARSSSSEPSIISSRVEIVICSMLFLSRCDVLNDDLPSIRNRLEGLKQRIHSYLDDSHLSAFACKALLWLCYIDIRIAIFSSPETDNNGSSSTALITLLGTLIRHPNYKQILNRSHAYRSEIFGHTYPPEEQLQDAQQIPASVSTHETFVLISKILQYRSWRYLAKKKPDSSDRRELAAAKEEAISLDMQRMDAQFDLAVATDPAAAVLHVAHNASEDKTDRVNSRSDSPNISVSSHTSSTTLSTAGSAVSGCLPISDAALRWLSCYAAFLTVKILWSRTLYPGVRSEKSASIAVRGILRIALLLRRKFLHNTLVPTASSSPQKVPRSMLWPLPLLMAGIETTDDIHADWISAFMTDMTMSRNVAVGLQTNTAKGHAAYSKTVADRQQRLQMLMALVREKQDLTRSRVNVQDVMCELSQLSGAVLL